MNETRDLIIGIDFGKKYSQISCYDRKAEEPRSLPVKAGSSDYESPTLLCCRADRSDFCIGIEAEYFAREKNGVLIEDLYRLVEENESINLAGKLFEASDLLAAFLHEMLKFVGVMDIARNTSCLAIAMETLGANQVEILRKAVKILGFDEKQCLFLDYEECFYYHVMTQKTETWNRSIGWFTFNTDHVRFRKLVIGTGSKPAPVYLEKPVETDLPQEDQERDETFYRFVKESLGTDVYSSIQINGEGFDQSWAVKSVSLLCFQKRKVFYGSNLFACGACAAGAERLIGRRLKDYTYLSSSQVMTGIGMDMRIMGAPAYYPLIEAGRNWYECSASCELILDDTEELIFTISTMGENEKKKVAMQLPGLPKRPNKTTRLLLKLDYISREECRITVKDLGFGEMFPSSGKIWKETARW